MSASIVFLPPASWPYLVATDLGVVPGTDCTTTLNTAIATAIAAWPTIVGLYLPAGTYIIDSHTGTTGGVHINIPDNQSFLLFGAGGDQLAPQTVLQRKDAATMVDNSYILKVTNNTGITWEMSNLQLDGNARGTPVPTHPYDWEHSASVAFSVGSGFASFVHYHDLSGYDPIADHLFFNVHVTNATVERWRSQGGRTTRVRSDVQWTSWPNVGYCNDIVCDDFHSEAGTPQAGSVMTLNNITTVGFDWAQNASFQGTTIATNIYADFPPDSPVTNAIIDFFGVTGSFTNCTFKGVDRYQRNNCTFTNCDLYVYGHTGTPTIARTAEVWQDVGTPNDALEILTFDTCRFHTMPGVVTGSHLSVATHMTSLVPQTVLTNCTTVDAIDYTLTASAGGTVNVNGGILKGNIAAVSTGNDGQGGVTYYTTLTMSGMDNWVAAAALNIGAVGGPMTINLSGNLDGEVTKPSVGALGANVNSTYNSTRNVIVDSTPNNRLKGIPGDMATLRIAPFTVWHYTSSTQPNLTAWA